MGGGLRFAPSRHSRKLGEDLAPRNDRGVETIGDRSAYDSQRQPFGRSPGHLEVETVERASADQPVGFARNLRRDREFEGSDFFLAAFTASNLASQSCAQISVSFFVRPRNRRCAARCACVSSTASTGTMRVRVFPATAQVRDQLGI